MKELTYVASQIGKKKDLDKNLPEYYRRLAENYKSLAFLKLSMNYYSLVDMVKDSDDKSSIFINSYESFNKILNNIIKKQSVDLSAIENLRNQITSNMLVIVQYVENLSVYEHVFNRVEYRFKDYSDVENYYQNYFTNDLMHYILSDKDNTVIRSKISEVVGQLPMRLSRNKFYEYLRDAYTLYRGANIGTIDDMSDSIRSSASIKKPEGYETLIPECVSLLEKLSAVDYDKIGEEEFAGLSAESKTVSDRLIELSDDYVLLTMLINDLYTIALLAQVDDAESEISKEIIEATLKSALSREEIDESLLDKFVLLEGSQERINVSIESGSYALDDAKALAEEKGLTDLISAFETLYKVSLLQTDSTFATLNTDPKRNEISDNAYVEKACQDLIDDFKTMFESKNQYERRAIMSAVFAQLPIFFNKVDDIQNYINFSLIQCSDEAEKAAVVDLLKSIMDQQ